MRHYYIDWLRVITVGTVFLFHNARVFDSLYWWHIKSAQSHPLLTLFVIFADQWIMPLLFFLAGASVYFNLRLRKLIRFVVERVKRLAVPLLFGIIIIAPPQAYLEKVFRMLFEGSFWQYLPEHFINYMSYRLTENFWFWWVGPSHHLWFLGFLFIFSLAALPLFLFWQRGFGQRAVSVTASIFSKPGALFLLFVPLAIIQVAFEYRFPHYLDWTSFFYWFIFFLYGYLLFADQRFLRAVERNGKAALLLAAVTFIPVTASLTGLFDFRHYFSSYPGYVFEWAVSSLNAWSLVIALLFLGTRYLNHDHSLLNYAREGALPFYILHQTAIVIVSFYVVRWSAGALSQFLVITAISMVLSMAVYELFIRRYNPVRFIFGMRLSCRQFKPEVGEGLTE